MKKADSKSKLPKGKEKPTKKDKQSTNETKPKKKKSKKTSEQPSEEKKVVEETKVVEEVKSRELLSIEKESEKVDLIFETIKRNNLTLDSVVKSESLNSYLNPEKYGKLNRNALFQANLPLEKYHEALSSVNYEVKQSLDGLQEFKYLNEENRNLNYRLEMFDKNKEQELNRSENEFRSLTSLLSKQSKDVRDLVSTCQFNSAFNYVPKDENKFDENELRSLFQNLRFLIKNVNDSISEKEKEINFLKYDLRSIADEISGMKNGRGAYTSLGRHNFSSLTSGEFPFSLKSNPSASIEVSQNNTNNNSMMSQYRRVKENK